MAFVDPYTVLQVPRSASQDDIKRSYKKLVLEFHPDRNKNTNASNQFRQIIEAYKILSDEKKRKKLDQNYANFTGPGADTNKWFQDYIENVLKHNVDPFNRHTPFYEKGEDVEVRVLIELKEAALGCHKDVQIPDQLLVCPACNGSRTSTGRKILCTACGGTGRIYNRRSEIKCPVCAGFGDKPLAPCQTCHGSGRFRSKRNITVKIPPGVNDGTRLRLAGLGLPGVNSPNGDLFIEIHTLPNERFERKGIDLYTTFAVPLIKAMNGGTVEIPGLTGSTMKVMVPHPLEPGKSLMHIPGAGMKALDGRVGDMYIIFQVELPKTITARAIQLMMELEKELASPQ